VIPDSILYLYATGYPVPFDKWQGRTFGIGRAAKHLSDGFVAAVPNMEQWMSGSTLVYGAYAFKSDDADVKNPPKTQLASYLVGTPYDINTPEGCLCASSRYATALGYAGGFPSFEMWDAAGTQVWEVVCVKPSVAQVIQVPQPAMAPLLVGTPFDVNLLEGKQLAASRFAVNVGLLGAIVNSEQEISGGVLSFGALAFKK
jgi:hypothetical protein